jgi:hypothetical protein
MLALEAGEAELMERIAELPQAMDKLGYFVLGLAILVLVVGIFVTHHQRRIARNQVELADLVRKSLAPKAGE